MSLRRTSLVLALGVASFAGTTSADAATPRIVGGTLASIVTHPYQVALVGHSRPNGPTLRAFCGGSILDATHIVTAAHCTYEEDESPSIPGTIDVVAGLDDIGDHPLAGQRIRVASITRHPSWNPVTLDSDAAVLTLTTPLTLDGTVTPVAISDAPLAAGTIVTVSGFGILSPNQNAESSQFLRSVDVPVVDDTACANAYFPIGLVAPDMLCAGTFGKDSCNGDSGGPAVRYGTRVLEGIVSFGIADQCGGSIPGVYTEVAAPAMRNYLLASIGVPITTTPPAVTGTARAGDTLTCVSGPWSLTPALTYAFFTDPQAPRALTALSASPTYAVTDADAGHQLFCRVVADGRNQATSAPTGIVAVRPDTSPPSSKVRSKTCSLTVCRISIRLSDGGYSTGLKAVEVKVTTRYRVACTKRGRRTTCARTRNRTKTIAATTSPVAVSLRGLRSGTTHTVRITAIDAAGNREPGATVTKVTTKKRR